MADKAQAPKAQTLAQVPAVAPSGQASAPSNAALAGQIDGGDVGGETPLLDQAGEDFVMSTPTEDAARIEGIAKSWVPFFLAVGGEVGRRLSTDILPVRDEWAQGLAPTRFEGMESALDGLFGMVDTFHDARAAEISTLQKESANLDVKPLTDMLYESLPHLVQA